jgi:hypothetical protein
MLPRTHLLLLVAAALVGACARQEPMPLTPPAETGSAPVVRRPAEQLPPGKTDGVPPLASGAPSGQPAASPAPPALAGIVVPPEAIYVCVVERGGQRSATVIEFEPKVLALCRKHPEMGPCQYERNVCRASGGRVLAANGQEITMATEAEYDKKVRRVRFTSK